MLSLLAGCAKSSDIQVALKENASISFETEAYEPDITVSQKSVESEAKEEPASVTVDTLDEDNTKETPIEAIRHQNVNGTLQITFLDVGQGDSIYISLPNGECILIDAGESSESDKIIQYIRENNDKSVIDYLITTHPHADHIGGMLAVIEAFDVKSVWMPNATHTTETFENLLDAIAEKELMFDVAKTGKILFDFGNLKAEFISPIKSRYSELNDYSAVLLLTYNDCRFLFMGDAEKEAEDGILLSGYDIHADVIKIGHHGSETSSTRGFIQKVNPRYAVISCGKGNSYGHPSSQTLDILAEFGIEVLRTDESGSIEFIYDGNDILINTYQAEILPRAPTPASFEITEQDAVGEPAENVQKQGYVYITKSGSKYHLDGCRYLSQSKIAIDLEAAKQKYGPCSVCKPPE